jgi:hypothetical protein
MEALDWTSTSRVPRTQEPRAVHAMSKPTLADRRMQRAAWRRLAAADLAAMIDAIYTVRGNLYIGYIIEPAAPPRVARGAARPPNAHDAPGWPR